LPRWSDTDTFQQAEYEGVVRAMSGRDYSRLEGELTVNGTTETVTLCKTADPLICKHGLLVLTVEVPNPGEGSLQQGGIAHGDPL
jgi:hypothetical protein